MAKKIHEMIHNLRIFDFLVLRMCIQSIEAGHCELWAPGWLNQYQVWMTPKTTSTNGFSAVTSNMGIRYRMQIMAFWDLLHVSSISSFTSAKFLGTYICRTITPT